MSDLRPPHCGAVAAHAYARLGRASARGIRRVVLLGPAHRLALDGLAAPDAQAFETPLGRVAVDLAALAALDELPQLTRSDRAHEGEHSIEVQLPFLQTRLGSGFTLVPLVVGAAQAADRATAFRILALDAGLAPHEACGAAAIKGALLAAGRHGLAAGLLAGRRCPTAQGLRSGLSLTASASARIGRSEGTALAAA